ADDLQVRKQRLFKLLPRLGIIAAQRREPSRGNQLVATVTSDEAKRIRAAVDGAEATATKSLLGIAGPRAADDAGWFYLIQLEPSLDPGRFKLGFSVDLDGRLQKHRCAAPFASYLKHWPCRRGWEQAAMDCIANGSERLHTEVFRMDDMAGRMAIADQFFGL